MQNPDVCKAIAERPSNDTQSGILDLLGWNLGP